MNPDKPKTFCLVATNGASLTNFRGALIRTLVAKGFRVVCVSIEPDAEVGESVRMLGAEYRQVAGSRVGIGLLSGLKMILAYRRLFRELRPDYLFLYMSKPIAFGGAAAILEGLPHVNVLVNGLENAYYRKGAKDALVRLVMSFFYKRIARKAENVFFQNHDDCSYFITHGMLTSENYHVVGGSGVDMEYFARQELPAEPVVLLSARLLWSKGIREFFEAVQKVKASHPEMRVLLIGGLDSNDEAITEEELNRFIQQNNVEYCGFAKDVCPYLKRCSIFVLPSYHEGMPRSILEAMAVGRPILTTDVPGCREAVQDGENGFLVPARDGGELAEKLEILVSDGALRQRMGEASWRICRQRFEVSKVNSDMLESRGIS